MGDALSGETILVSGLRLRDKFVTLLTRVSF